MGYFKEIKINTRGQAGSLYVTDDRETAAALRDRGEAVVIYSHEGNRNQSCSGFLYAVENPEGIEEDYWEKVYRRLKGLPWDILETRRCLIRETVPEDVEDFYQIYSNPAITEFTEGLYPDKEQEKEYIREYIKRIYTYYEFGVWTVVEKESGDIIGRAGFSCREGYDDPELGFIIGVPWQRRGYAEEVCRGILLYGWECLEFDRVQALVEVENTASLKLCDKLGFHAVEELTMKDRQYFRLILEK